MWAIFAVPINGSLLLLWALIPIFLFAGLGPGPADLDLRAEPGAGVPGVVPRDPALGAALGLLLPSRIDASRWSIPFTTIIPVTYFLEILRGIILRGAGWAELWRQSLILLGMGVAILVVAAARFRKRLG